jgi:hypothetical protein
MKTIVVGCGLGVLACIVGAPAYGATKACTGPGDRGCLNKALEDMLSSKDPKHAPESSESLTVKLAAGQACPAATTATLEIANQTVAPPPVVTCSGGIVTVTLLQDKLTAALAQVPVQLSITGLATPITLTGQVPEMAPAPPARTPAATPDPEEKAPTIPIDIPPLNIDLNVDRNTDCSDPSIRKDKAKACWAMKDAIRANDDRGGGKKYVLVDETLTVREGSAEFVTESDTVIVRFIVRNALACRVHADSDSANVNDNSLFRLGGQVSSLSPLKSFLSTGGKAADLYSCGSALQPFAPDEQVYPKIVNPPDAGSPASYTVIDFRFGPFTSDELTFHLTRHDRTLVGTDMTNTIKVENHKRYAGWFDIWTGVNVFHASDDTLSVANDNGTQVSRLHVDANKQKVDLAALAKVYLKCSGSAWFRAADAKESAVCFGLAAGLSVLHPTKTFYPFGINFTFHSAVSVHALLSVNVVSQPTDAYADNEVFAGNPSTVPTKTLLTPGFGLGVGLDPTIFAMLLKAMITGH